MRFLPRSSLSVLAVLVAACSSSGDSVTGSSVPPEVTALARGICDYYRRCTPDVVDAAFADASACVSAYEISGAAVLKAPGVTLTQASADACAVKLASANCHETSLEISVVPECRFKGTLTNGTPCVDDAQCSSGLCKVASSNDTTTASRCGTCAPIVTEGGDCTTDSCEAGLRCRDGKCVARVSAGSPCTTRSDCRGNLSCVADRCAEPHMLGAPCSAATAECDANAGLFCKPGEGSADGACAATTYASVGDRCGLDVATKVTTSCRASSCVANAGTFACAALLAKDASCQPEGPGCAQPYACLDGKCTLPDSAACK